MLLAWAVGVGVLFRIVAAFLSGGTVCFESVDTLEHQRHLENGALCFDEKVPFVFLWGGENSSLWWSWKYVASSRLLWDGMPESKLPQSFSQEKTARTPASFFSICCFG